MPIHVHDLLRSTGSFVCLFALRLLDRLLNDPSVLFLSTLYFRPFGTCRRMVVQCHLPILLPHWKCSSHCERTQNCLRQFFFVFQVFPFLNRYMSELLVQVAHVWINLSRNIQVLSRRGQVEFIRIQPRVDFGYFHVGFGETWASFQG